MTGPWSVIHFTLVLFQSKHRGRGRYMDIRSETHGEADGVALCGRLSNRYRRRASAAALAIFFRAFLSSACFRASPRSTRFAAITKARLCSNSLLFVAAGKDRYVLMRVAACVHSALGRRTGNGSYRYRDDPRNLEERFVVFSAPRDARLVCALERFFVAPLDVCMSGQEQIRLCVFLSTTSVFFRDGFAVNFGRSFFRCLVRFSAIAVGVTNASMGVGLRLLSSQNAFHSASSSKVVTFDRRKS